MKRTMFAMALGALFVLGSGAALAKPAGRGGFPNLEAAKKALNSAKKSCEAAEKAHEKHGTLGGNGAKCVEHIEAALKAVADAEAFAKEHAEGAKGEAKEHEAEEHK